MSQEVVGSAEESGHSHLRKSGQVSTKGQSLSWIFTGEWIGVSWGRWGHREKLEHSHFKHDSASEEHGEGLLIVLQGLRERKIKTRKAGRTHIMEALEVWLRILNSILEKKKKYLRVWQDDLLWLLIYIFHI